jgi:hypothetical protein
MLMCLFACMYVCMYVRNVCISQRESAVVPVYLVRNKLVRDAYNAVNRLINRIDWPGTKSCLGNFMAICMCKANCCGGLDKVACCHMDRIEVPCFDCLVDLIVHNRLNVCIGHDLSSELSCHASRCMSGATKQTVSYLVIHSL